jgi:DNA-binding GntR family transcriptional regulator
MTLVVQTLSEQIFAVVRDRIVSGHVSGETPIRQDALANELGVSKIPLREALARLEQEGLLVSQANRGFFLRPLSVEEAEEIFALRIKIEPDAVGEAAIKASDADRKAARAALDALDKATAKHSDDVGRLNREFHLALTLPAGKRITARLVERLHILSERYVRKHLEPNGRDGRAIEEHEHILAAWMDKDGDVAAQLTRAHIALTLADLRKQFDVDTTKTQKDARDGTVRTAQANRKRHRS